MVSAVNAWKTRTGRVEGELRCMQDAEVWKTLRGHDGELFFFGPSAEEELRLGVSFSVDWFGRKTSSYGPSHSSGVMSFCVQNLDMSQMYRADNLILSQMPPGPQEPTGQQLQNYLKIIVDDLLKLYEDGIVVKTPEHPNGKLFYSSASMIPDLLTILLCARFVDLRTIATMLRLALNALYLMMNFSAKSLYETYTVIDPMHNLLLGLAKTQWYTVWVKTGALRPDTAKFHRELHTIHEFLESFESPLWAGRLPLRVGEPAGGSLTADEYKFAVTGPWAIIIPVVWERFFKEARKEHEVATRRYPALFKEYEKKKEAWERGGKRTAEPKAPMQPRLRMQEGEDENFLQFAAFLKIVVGNSIRTDTLPTVRQLLQDYLLRFLEFYGADNMKPNHHWAVHIPEQIVQYGPLNGFWAFLTERLNKILKNLNSNNWTGGRLEVSMMREFHRSTRITSVLSQIEVSTRAPSPSTSEHEFVQLLLGSADNVEAIGTVQDAAHAETLNGSRIVAGSIAEENAHLGEEDILLLELFTYYNESGPKVHFAGAPTPGATMLSPFIDFYEFALLDGKRLTPTTRSRRNTAGSSIVQARHKDEAYAGEVQHLIRHRQPGISDVSNNILAHILWMKRSNLTPLDDGKFPWDKYPQLGVETWEHNTYANPNDKDFPPTLMPLNRIHCQIARGTISHTEPPLWITVTMDRFPTSLLAYGFGDKVE
ncbi:hypothetical protein MVEN_00144000 [Mycena venus]|uniref:Uncharacterized protein n=1 Tax=Mycena venus TaxID=2733690 RepID=A0A8H6Z0M9_9AGAR|nr:hypothetical protein MVEN_00144000 [Mycena venus]